MSPSLLLYVGGPLRYEGEPTVEATVAPAHNGFLVLDKSVLPELPD
jgi:hypothetical protein